MGYTKKIKMGRILINCIIITAIYRLLTPLFIISEYVPEKEIEFRDFKEKDHEIMSNLPNDQVVKYVEENVKLRKLSGFERITYIFESPFSANVYLWFPRATYPGRRVKNLIV